MLYALTVWQPWAWCIGAGIKLVENRSWLPSYKLLKEGDDLAIHAGVQAPTKENMAAARIAAAKGGHEVPLSSSHELGPTYGRGRIVAVVKFVGIARAEGDLRVEQRPWWVGKYGWLFEDVRQLQLSSAPQVLGQQGLWALSPGVEKMVRSQLARPAGELWRKTA